MAKPINITIADKIYAEIQHMIKKQNIKNKSEFITEILRTGLLYSYNIEIIKEPPKRRIKMDSNELIQEMIKLPNEELQTLALYCKKELNKRFSKEGEKYETN
jgi:metal-responsive CopG/Arc/MetJ family transcriptional regulator